MIRAEAFRKRILALLRDILVCSALPVPSEDNNPEDGHKVEKIKAGREHWDWLQGLHRVWSCCKFLLLFVHFTRSWNEPSVHCMSLAIQSRAIKQFNMQKPPFIHLFFASVTPFLWSVMLRLSSPSACLPELPGVLVLSQMVCSASSVTFDLSYSTLLVL